MNKLVAVTIFCLSTAAPALATDLTNKDSQKYEVKVETVGTLNTSIESNTTYTSICSRACTVKVVGVGRVEITGKEKAIVIRAGKLSVEK
jgi:hypothetical protein